MGLVLPGIKMVYFDAVGTLLFRSRRPARRTSAPDSASEFGHSGGLHGKVPRGLRRTEAIDAANGYRTSEERERERWRPSWRSAADVTDAEECFVYLWDWFAQPANWRAAPEAASVIFGLRQRGIPADSRPTSIGVEADR